MHYLSHILQHNMHNLEVGEIFLFAITLYIYIYIYISIFLTKNMLSIKLDPAQKSF